MYRAVAVRRDALDEIERRPGHALEHQRPHLLKPRRRQDCVPFRAPPGAVKWAMIQFSASSRPMLSIIVPVYRNEQNIDRLVQELERIAAISPTAARSRLRGRRQSRSLARTTAAGGCAQCGVPLQARIAQQKLRRLQRRALRSRAGLGRVPGGAAGRSPGTRRSGVDVPRHPQTRRSGHRLRQAVEPRRPLVRRGHVAGLLGALPSLVLPELPRGRRATPFGCTRWSATAFSNSEKPTTNLIALFFWLGFRRAYVPYDRQRGLHGRSAWTLAKKLRYGFESRLQLHRCADSCCCSASGFWAR